MKWFKVKIKHTALTGVFGRNGVVVKSSQAPIHVSGMFTVLPEGHEHATIHMPLKEVKPPIVKEKNLKQESVKEVQYQLSLRPAMCQLVKDQLMNLVTDMEISGLLVQITAAVVHNLVRWFISVPVFQVLGSVKMNGTKKEKENAPTLVVKPANGKSAKTDRNVLLDTDDK